MLSIALCKLKCLIPALGCVQGGAPAQKHVRAFPCMLAASLPGLKGPFLE